MTSWLLGQVPTGDSGTPLVTILVLLLGGSAGTTILALWRQHRQGANERDTLIADATNTAVQAARSMLEEYRIELAEAKTAILELRQDLAEAGVRIAKLERELMAANGDRERLQAALGASIERRAAMVEEMETMRKRIADLEAVVNGP